MRSSRTRTAALALLLAAPQASGATPLFAAIMAGLAAQPDRQAGFFEEKRLTSLQAPLRSQGRLVFRHPAHLEKTTVAPPERMVIDDGRLTLFAANQPPRTVELDAHPALRALATTIVAMLAGDAAALQRFYAVNATGTQARWQLGLRPSSAEIARAIRSVTIDGSYADIGQLTIVQANNDSQVLTITKAP